MRSTRFSSSPYSLHSSRFLTFSRRRSNKREKAVERRSTPGVSKKLRSSLYAPYFSHSLSVSFPSRKLNACNAGYTRPVWSLLKNLTLFIRSIPTLQISMSSQNFKMPQLVFAITLPDYVCTRQRAHQFPIEPLFWISFHQSIG